MRLILAALLLVLPAASQQSAGSTAFSDDPTGDVETWSGLVLPGGPTWDNAPVGPGDLREFYGALFIDAVTWHGEVKDIVALGWQIEGLPSCPPGTGEPYYWVDTHFSYRGRDFRLAWTNEQCAETTVDISGRRTLWIDGELLGSVDSLGGAAHLYAEQVDKDYRTWHNDSIIEGLYITSLVRESKEPCDMSSLASNCGRHWRDRQPDVGTYPDLAFNGTPRFVPKGELSEPPGKGASAPLWPLIAVVWMVRRQA